MSAKTQPLSGREQRTGIKDVRGPVGNPGPEPSRREGELRSQDYAWRGGILAGLPVWQFRVGPSRVDQGTAALTIEAHIMVGEDGWAVSFRRAPDHHMQKAIRRLNVVFLEGTDGIGSSGS